MDLEANDGDAVRVTLIGPSQTGKSTFANSIVSRTVLRSGSYHRTSRNITRYVQIKPRDGTGVLLEDTVGTNKIQHENFDIARNQVFIVFFDSSRPETRRSELDIAAEIRIAETNLKRRPPRPLMILGNKRDAGVAQEVEREMDKLRKAVHALNAFLFSGSVIANSFSMLERPKRFDKSPYYFCRLYEVHGLNDDFRLNFTAVQLVENMRALFDEISGGGWGMGEKAETQPLIPGASVEEEDDEDESACARCCRRCRRHS